MSPIAIDEAIPVSELVRAGLADLAAGRRTIEGLLVLQARIGFEAGASWCPTWLSANPAAEMYELIERDVGPRRAHARYNALRRRLSSFIHSAPFAASAD